MKRKSGRRPKKPNREERRAGLQLLPLPPNLPKVDAGQQGGRGFLFRWSRFWAFAGPAVALFSFYWLIQPDVKMQNLTPPDPSNVFTTPFVIQNFGNFTVKNVLVNCGQDWVGKSGLRSRTANRDPNGTIPAIDRHENATAACYNPFTPVSENPFKGGLFFHLRFHYGWWPFQITRHYAFQAVPQGSNTLLVPQPSGVFGFPDHPDHPDFPNIHSSNE
jgi:hypothetical protein